MMIQVQFPLPKPLLHISFSLLLKYYITVYGYLRGKVTITFEQIKYQKIKEKLCKTLIYRDVFILY